MKDQADLNREHFVHTLLLDDDPYFRESMKEYLEWLGTKVSVASTVEDAKRLLEQETFQVVISDIFLGKSEATGDDFIIQNAKLMKGARIFAITGYPLSNIKRFDELRNRGVKVIQKGPGMTLDIKDVIDNYRQALEASGGVTKSQHVNTATVKEAEQNLNIRRLRVFLCHSSNDKPSVRALYKRLRDNGIEPWLDEESLLPGEEWEVEIPRAVRHSDIVLVCLSNESINKRGYVQKEIKFALDVADQQPEGTIFIIPVKLEECEVPERLRRWQWVNLNDAEGYEKLKHALESRKAKLF